MTPDPVTNRAVDFKGATLNGVFALNQDQRCETGGAIGGGLNHTAFGIRALSKSVGGIGHTAFGYDALDFVETCNFNSAFGYDGLWALKKGGGNSGFGAQTGMYNEMGVYNTYAGSEAGKGGPETASHSYSTFIGGQSGFMVGTASYTTCLGYGTGFRLVTGNRDLFLGAFAGAWQTGSQTFVLDVFDRGSASNEEVSALMFGHFDQDPAKQTLRINAAISQFGGDAFVFQGVTQEGDTIRAHATINGKGYSWPLTPDP